MLKPCVAVALALSVILMPCIVFALDDDFMPDDADVGGARSDDSSELGSGAQRRGQGGEEESVMRIALFKVNQTVDAEKRSSRDMVPLIHRQLKEALSAINVRPAKIVEHDSLLNNMNRRQQMIYSKCWVDHTCIAGVLEGSGIDIALVGKLSAKIVETDASTGSSFLELSLLVKLIDLKDTRIIKEFLIVENDETRLSEKSYDRLYSELERLGFIVDRSRMEDDPSASKASDIYFETPKVVEQRSAAMQIAKWTTLGGGLACLGLGGVFTGLASKASGDQKNASNIDDLKNSRNKRDNYMLASYILYGVGGGLLISSVVLFVLDSQQSGSGGDEVWSGTSFTPTEGGAFMSTEFKF